MGNGNARRDAYHAPCYAFLMRPLTRPVPAAASRLTALYNRHFDTHPLLTLTATNGVLSSISDLVVSCRTSSFAN